HVPSLIHRLIRDRELVPTFACADVCATPSAEVAHPRRRRWHMSREHCGQLFGQSGIIGGGHDASPSSARIVGQGYGPPFVQPEHVTYGRDGVGTCGACTARTASSFAARACS